MNSRSVARPFAMIGTRSSRYIVFFSPHLRSRELARSREQNSQTSNLPPNPQILTRHRCTAGVRVVGIATSRTESLTVEPSPESNDLAMSRLRIRESIFSPCVGLAPSLNVCTLKNRNCCTAAVHSSTAVIAHEFWAHIGSSPATGSTADASLLRKRSSDVLDRNLFFIVIEMRALSQAHSSL